VRGWTAFRPLRHRNFALVWSAAAISNIGTWMETVAVGDLVAHRTGQAGWTALVAAAGFLPMGLMGPIGGAIADHVDRRRFMFVTTLLQTVCAALLAVEAATDHASPGAVVFVVFAAGCVAGIGFPAYQSMLPDMVPQEDLLAAVSLGQAQFNFGRVIGPALAGVAIAVGSYTAAFTINTISFGAMLLALLALRLDERDRPPPEGSILSRIRVGVRVARAEPGVRVATLMIAVAALTVSPFIGLIPAMARVRFHSDEVLTSAFVTAQGLGAVAGALLVPTLAERFGRHRVLMYGLLALPASVVLYGAAPTSALAFVALLLVGGTYISVLGGLGTVVQLRAPAELRARVLSIYFLALGTLYPIGLAIQGPIADRVGLGEVTVAGALLLLVVVVLVRAVRPERLLALDDLEAYPAGEIVPV